LACRHALSALFAVFLGLGHARADGEQVRLVASCVPAEVSLDEVATILRAELAPAEVAVVPAAEPGVAPAEVTIELDDCRDDPPELRATTSAGGSQSTRLVDLSDAAPGTRDRTLALSLAETIRADRVVEAPVSPPALPPAPEPPRQQVDKRPQKPTSPAGATSFRVAATGRYAIKTVTPAAGVEVGVHFRRLVAGGLLVATGRDTELGNLSLIVGAALLSLDALSFSDDWGVRISGELGACPRPAMSRIPPSVLTSQRPPVFFGAFAWVEP
jgi:hypothetical protein